MRPFTLVITSLLCLCASSSARADLEIKPHAAVTEEYDSNINYSATNEISDSITRVQAGADLQYSGKLDSVTLSADVAHRFFQKHSDFDNTSENLSLNLDHEFSRYDRINVVDSFSHSTEPRSLTDEFERSQGRYTSTINTLDLTYKHDLTSQLTGILRYGNEIDEYSREDISDSSRNTLGVGAEFAFNSTNVGLVDYSYSVRDYSPGGSAETNSVTAGVRHYFSSQLSLQAVAGYEFISAVNGKSYTDPVYTVTLSDSITEKLEGSLSYRWENSTSGYSSDVLSNERWTLSFVDQVTERLKVNLQGFYGQGTYEQSQLEQDMTGGSFGFMYELFAHVKWTTQVSYSKQTSNYAYNEYDRTFVSSGIRIEF